MTDADTTDPHAEPQPDRDLSEDAGSATEADDLEERLVAEGEIAGDYLEELLDLL
ncbi:MAG TPA: single-stranded DNA-binding protein, partial [Mycobacterium sp.]|nr:single-stranded DNA-binding protein [Mycobacterium sp.]